MKPLQVVITDPNLLPLRDTLAALLPPDTQTTWACGQPDAALFDALRSADAIVGPEFTTAMAEAAPNLRLVHVAGAGTERIDPAALTRGIRVANTYHHERSIAEYVVWALVALRRDLPGVDAALRRGRWQSPVYERDLPQPQSLEGATIGFIGFGRIGHAAWHVLHGLGAKGCAITHSGRADADGLTWVGPASQLDRLLADADAVVVSAPLTESSRGMIGAAELAALGHDGIVVNVARGPVVGEEALYAALRDHTIRGAALDVWYSYPGPDGQARPAAAAFEELDNVLMTPHISGLTRQTFLARIHDIADNLAALSRGEELRNLVDLQPTTTGTLR